MNPLFLYSPLERGKIIMADDKKKKISLGGIDNAAEEKGSFMKTLGSL